MNRISFSGSGRLLQIMSLVFVTFMFAGCCSMPDLNKCCKKKGFVKPMDVMYQFDYPESPADCPDNTTFVSMEDVENGSLDPRSGGAGIVERDGGAGIVDRENKFLTSWCQIDCLSGEPTQDNPQMEWSFWNDKTDADGKPMHPYVVASVRCE